mmetsp:Transcript_70613/g.188489  ORF Transcript_70613/g.188489 Transcript_70613/m.188489 type:complete len:87 (+) Transcript_70613:178-438(+)
MRNPFVPGGKMKLKYCFLRKANPRIPSQIVKKLTSNPIVLDVNGPELLHAYFQIVCLQNFGNGVVFIAVNKGRPEQTKNSMQYQFP